MASKGVKLTKAQALKLLDWHGGGGSAVYALGSSSFSGNTVPLSVASDAIKELTVDLRRKPKKGFWGGWTSREKASLRQRIADIKKAMVKGR
ncbi:hypothetical protein LCGC14_2967320 [marine sediment metagenome]|uniref:Uncharacterized protein n=1 Tax=marine sediment metagenome TaxID=412755 RepID=A0A0F8XAE2_9ZZZZ